MNVRKRGGQPGRRGTTLYFSPPPAADVYCRVIFAHGRDSFARSNRHAKALNRLQSQNHNHLDATSPCIENNDMHRAQIRTAWFDRSKHSISCWHPLPAKRKFVVTPIHLCARQYLYDAGQRLRAVCRPADSITFRPCPPSVHSPSPMTEIACSRALTWGDWWPVSHERHDRVAVRAPKYRALDVSRARSETN